MPSWSPSPDAPEAPAVLAKTRIDVATTFDEGAVFHVAQTRPLGEARRLVRAREALFTKRARAALADFVGALGAKVVGIGLAAGPEKVLPPFETILKAHPLLHAAEGELYRRVFAAAAPRGARVVRLPPPELLARIAAAHRVDGLDGHGAARRHGQGLGSALGRRPEAGGAGGVGGPERESRAYAPDARRSALRHEQRGLLRSPARVPGDVRRGAGPACEREANHLPGRELHVQVVAVSVEGGDLSHRLSLAVGALRSRLPGRCRG